MGESNFVLKVEAACQKKEELYTASKARLRFALCLRVLF